VVVPGAFDEWFAYSIGQRNRALPGKPVLERRRRPAGELRRFFEAASLRLQYDHFDSRSRFRPDERSAAQILQAKKLLGNAEWMFMLINNYEADEPLFDGKSLFAKLA
jgi:hypothetical protein